MGRGQGGLQVMMDRLSTVSKEHVMKINIKKTQALKID